MGNLRYDKVKLARCISEGLEELAKHNLTIHTDGGCETNPGQTSCGVVIKENGNIIFAAGKRMGYGTNNTAEYSGLLCALVYCLKRLKAGEEKYSDLAIFCDNAMMVNSIKKRWMMRHSPHLRILRDKALELISKFNTVKITWVPRELNSDADNECGKALGRAEVVARKY